jgi:hypothetical protein
VIVQLVQTTGGAATYDSITSFSFTGATLPTVSTSYSSTTLGASSAPATAGTGVSVKTTVADPNNSPILSGATVTWTATGPGVFATTPSSATNSAVATSATCLSGPGTCAIAASSVNLNSTGVPGTVTVATTVSYLGVTYTLGNQTVVFYGPPAKVVLSNLSSSIDDGNPATSSTATLANGDKALMAVVTDAAGNAITTGVTFGSPTYAPANIFTLDLAGSTYTAPAYNSTDGGWTLSAVCTTFGKATVSVQATVGSTTVTSNAATLVCADPLTSTSQGTFTVSAKSPTVAPNGTDTISVNVKDDNGLPAPDGTSVSAYTNGVGAVVSGGTNPNAASTSNGVAAFTYLAPSNAASATVTVFVGNTTTGSAAVTLTIGTPAPAVSATAGTVLGLGTSGSSYSAATKIAKYGQYVTWQFGFGSAAAGKNVTIWLATKSASGTWSAFKPFTGRIADANGNAYFHWKFTKAAWISVEAQLGTTITPARQARWM